MGHRHLRSGDQPDVLGHQQPGADVRPVLSPGRQPLHQQRDLVGPRNRPDELVFSIHPGDMWDYDEVGTHILVDGEVAGQQRKLITHSARNGFLYTMERANGAIALAKPYTEANWTKGIDQKTGKPLDYDPTKDIQTYAGTGNLERNSCLLGRRASLRRPGVAV
jgi:hypothetical protein